MNQEKVKKSPKGVLSFLKIVDMLPKNYFSAENSYESVCFLAQNLWTGAIICLRAVN